MIRLALFASGAGSNVYNIIEYFKKNKGVEIVAVLSNNPEAGALNHAQNAGIETLIFSRQEFFNTDKVLNFLREKMVDNIILAGFLWKIPENMIIEYPNKIINVHPALLPKYGGKGMYGSNVHKAVVAAKEKESGITIHQVNENYDEGAIIAQYTCSLDTDETSETLAKKIHILEKEYFPETIEKFIHQK